MFTRLSTAVLLASACTLGHAQEFPAKPIKLVVPYGAGTGVDIAARMMADRLPKVLGQPVVIDNRPGAAGGLGTGVVASSAPDGYTLLAHASSITSVPAYSNSVPYKLADLRGVSIYADMTYVLVASPQSNLKSVGDLVQAAKAKPGVLTFSSAGVGTGTYIGSEKVNIAAGIKAQHISYKSTTDAMTDIVAGRVDYGYTQITTALGFIKAGKLVPLAVSSAKSSLLPAVPSIEESYPSARYSLWIGIFAPAKTPAPVVERLGQAMAQVRDTEEFRAALLQAGGEAVKTTPAEVDAILRKEAIENEEMVKRLGIVKQ